MKQIYSVLMLALIAMYNLGIAQQTLDPADYFTADNALNLPQGAPGTTAEYYEVGNWFNGVSSSGFNGSYRQTSQYGGEPLLGRSATWVMNIPAGKQGNYLLYTYVLHAFNSSMSVNYKIQHEFSSVPTDSVQHSQQRSNIFTANPSSTIAQVGIGAWVPIMQANFDVGNTMITVYADSITGSGIMRADGIRILKSSSTGADLEFGRRYREGFDSLRVGESWMDASLGSLTYKEIPLYNLGAQDLVINDAYTKNNPSRWSIKLQEGETFPMTIPPGKRKNLSIGFRPFEEEYIEDTLVIVSNDQAEPEATLRIDGTGINYNFILNASTRNEPHYNAPFDNLGNEQAPQIILTGTWQSSETGVSPFLYPISGGNVSGIFSFDGVCSIEYRFQLPDSVNGKPGSAGNYFIEAGKIPFTSNSENNAQVTIVPAFSIDTVKWNYNQSGLTLPPFFVTLANKPIALNQGDFTSVKISRTIGTAAVLRADLLRVRKIPSGPTLSATPQINFGNVSIYEDERNAADNYRKDLEINSGGESILRIDSIVMSSSRHYTLVGMPQTPFDLAAINGEQTMSLEFKPDTIANDRNITIRIYSNDSTKLPYYEIPVTGNGIGTGVNVEENDVQGSFVFPADPVPHQDLTSLNKWQILPSGSSGSSYVGYIYFLQGDPAMGNKSYVEYFPSIPMLSGGGAQLDTFNVYARVPVGSVNSSPAVKYTIFQGAGGTPIEAIVNQNNRGSDRVFLGSAVFLRSGTRDAHGSGAINGYIRVENDTTLVNAYYADSLVNRARQDSMLIRADAIILLETLTGVEYEIMPNIPSKFDLSQNFPNPFNPTTRIRFDLPNSVNVQLRIFDILGREVRSLINERHDAGSYTVTWDGKNNIGRQVSSGVYIYHLKAGEFTSSKKMVMMK